MQGSRSEELFGVCALDQVHYCEDVEFLCESEIDNGEAVVVEIVGGGEKGLSFENCLYHVEELHSLVVTIFCQGLIDRVQFEFIF